MIDTRQLTAPHAPFFAALPPVYAAYFRGFAAALLVGVIEAAVHYLQVGPALPAAYEVLVPVAILLLRSAEGYVDHHSTATATAALAAAAQAPAPAPVACPAAAVPGNVTPVVVKTDSGYHIGAPDAAPQPAAAAPQDAGSGFTPVVNP